MKQPSKNFLVRKSPLSKTTKYISKKGKSLLMRRLETEAATGYYREGTFLNEFIWNGTSFIYSTQNKKQKTDFRKGLFLFSMVRADAKRFIAANEIKLPKKYPTVHYNKNMIDLDVKMTATDLNHAYWRIAYNLGIISSNTYGRGLPEQFKHIRLSALSTIGAGKRYRKIIKGVITDEIVEVGRNEELANVYKLIRYTCYKYMMDVKKLLKNDFIAYKTDCCYYVSTPENKKMVREYFKLNGLLMKQLN